MSARFGGRRPGWKRLFVVLGVLVIVGAIFAGGVVVGKYRYMKDFAEVHSLIQSRYLEQVPSSQLVEGAISGMVKSLDDPYSSYLDAETYAYMQEQIRGTFGGLGILVGVDDDYLTVVRTFNGTPADREGIMPGDKIARINGKDAEGMDLQTAVSLMRGPVGSEITLSLLRENREKPVELTLTREEISVPTVEGRMVEGSGIAHVVIAQFNRKTPGELEETLNEMKKRGMQGIVLDLRDNPGGELEAAKEVADEFIPRGPIVTVDYRQGKDFTFRADNNYLDLPLAVLVNGNSASASEILAGAIKDTGTGELVGTTTFGKGVVQTLFPLDNGGALKLTTARYLTPDNHNLHKKGIKPDMKIEADPGSRGDEQLQKAVEIVQDKISALSQASGQ